MTDSARRISVTEVGLRDGLQNEARILTSDEKLALAGALIAAGHRSLEATSFVSPTRVPQLADADDFIRLLGRRPGVEIKALTPNRRGAERAIAAGVDTLVFVMSASQGHGARNLNRTPEQSLDELPGVVAAATSAGAQVDVSLSVSFGCPFDGEVATAQTIAIARRCHEAGVTRMSFCDTTGMATPPLVRALARALAAETPALDPAFHFHNTRGLGLVGVHVALEAGVRRFESSVGGLGGCPFAPNAAGNVCTEDMVHMLHESGLETGLDLERLIAAAQLAQKLVRRPLQGQVMHAGPRLAAAARS